MNWGLLLYALPDSALISWLILDLLCVINREVQGVSPLFFTLIHFHLLALINVDTDIGKEPVLYILLWVGV